MPEFLQLLPPAEALATLLAHLPPAAPATERVDTSSALGRILSEPILAPHNLPGFDRSAVDGYAVHAADTHGASESLPAYLQLIGEVPMGSAPRFSLDRNCTALIHTGGMLPEGADAVVMLEQTQTSRPGEVEVLKAVAVNENILYSDEDVRAGQTVLTAGTTLRPAEIGGLMGLGLTKIEVTRKPMVGILSSGDEVIDPGSTLMPGQIRDMNSYSLSALVDQAGGVPKRYGIIPDDGDQLEVRLKKALIDCDLVIVTAGSSASMRDLTAEVINRLGKPGVVVHGVNVRPGKPTILGVCDGRAVIGLPGNPVSALVIARIFVIPVLERLAGKGITIRKPQIMARVTVNLASQAGREEYVPVRLSYTTDGLLADPIFFKSNLIFSLSQADGLLHIPSDSTGLSAGSLAMVDLLV